MTTPIRVIHYGMKYRSLQPSISKKELLQEIKIPENSSILGTIARLVPQKDYPTLLKALKMVLDTHPDTYLIAVGEGPLRFKLVELASKLGIQDHVKWIGKVENVDDYLQILDTFILSSTYEGFGLVLLEAANARIPIVATNTSAIPEVLGKDYPFLARPRDAMDFSTLIVRSLSKENYSFFLHENQNIMENFSVDKMLSKTIEVYENCK